MVVTSPPRFTSIIPTRCIERHPTRLTVYFAGTPINLAEVARSYEPPLLVPYLSYIFHGKRTPSLDYAEKLAFALGMQLQAFIEELKKERAA